MLRDSTSRSAAKAVESLTPEDFVTLEDVAGVKEPLHRRLFEACMGLTPPFNEIDLMLECPEHSGAITALAELHGGGLVDRYVSRLVKGRNHRAVRAAVLGVTDSLNRNDDPGEAASAFVAQVAATLNRRNGVMSAGKATAQAMADYLATDEGGPQALTTGFEPLDALLSGGFTNSALYVLAARPGVGKSSLAVHMSIQAATRGRRVAYASLEMDAGELGGRILTSVSGQRRPPFANFYKPGHKAKLADAVHSMRDWPIRLKDSPESTIDSICAFVARETVEGGVDLVIVDYLQLVTAPGHDSRQQEVSAVSRRLKLLSMEHSVPVVGLSQLNRALEQTGREPALSDLRDSGSIEQDADVVLLLSRSGEPGVSTDDILCQVAKNRSGPGGRLTLAFDKTFGRWSSAPRNSNVRNPY